MHKFLLVLCFSGTLAVCLPYGLHADDGGKGSIAKVSDFSQLPPNKDAVPIQLAHTQNDTKALSAKLDTYDTLHAAIKSELTSLHNEFDKIVHREIPAKFNKAGDYRQKLGADIKNLDDVIKKAILPKLGALANKALDEKVRKALATEITAAVSGRVQNILHQHRCDTFAKINAQLNVKLSC